MSMCGSGHYTCSIRLVSLLNNDMVTKQHFTPQIILTIQRKWWNFPPWMDGCFMYQKYQLWTDEPIWNLIMKQKILLSSQLKSDLVIL